MATLTVVLSLGTIGFVAAFAYIAARTAEKQLQEETSPEQRSTLCVKSPHWKMARGQ